MECHELLYLGLRGENPDSGSDVWGFSAGGPVVVRNKAFWFFNLERNLIDQAVSLVFPEEAAPLAQSFSDAAEIKVWNTFSKVDYQVSGNHRLSFRWVRESTRPISVRNGRSRLRYPEAVEVENDAGDHILSGNWTWPIEKPGYDEFKVSNIREDLLSGNRQYFDGDFDFIELAGRDQFDIGSMNDHPQDFLAGPAALHGSSIVRTSIVEKRLPSRNRVGAEPIRSSRRRVQQELDGAAHSRR